MDEKTIPLSVGSAKWCYEINLRKGFLEVAAAKSGRLMIAKKEDTYFQRGYFERNG